MRCAAGHGLWVLLSIGLAAAALPPLVEPYPQLHSDLPNSGPARPDSPDPLVRTTWAERANISGLQIYFAAPVSWTAEPSAAFEGLDTLSGRPNVTVLGRGWLRLDFGREHAGWFEFESSDLGSQAGGVTAAISEYNQPWPGKTLAPTGYAGGQYRLQTNAQLYEGVRFAWILFEPQQSAAPWHITGLRLVAQSKPVNYTGSYSSSDTVLSQAWYTGAYGSRLNMMPYGFNSILMDRGDRVSIQGDGHPTMAAALAAFGSAGTYDLVHKMLIKTDSGCANHSQCKVVDDGLMTYPLCWASSVHDWYWASGDTARFLELSPDIGRIVDHAVERFLQPGLAVQFVGWDDRIGNGFCGSCNLEVQLAFAAFTIRAAKDLATSLSKAGDLMNATKYSATAARLAGQLRARPSSTVPGGDWTADYGVHASAYLINARIVGTAEEQAALAKRMLTNSRTICSWSPFNQYWILQALGNVGMMEYAHASIKLCWGPMLQLGKGCFWELHSPEWSRFMNVGDKAPTRPSYCHPWSDGVTAWLSQVSAGIQPLEPGFKRYAALPSVSGRTPEVSASVGTPAGPIEVSAARDSVQGTVTVTVDAPVEGLVGLRLKDEESGCALDLRTVRVDGLQVQVRPSDSVPLVRLHPLLVSQHVYVSVPAGRHSVVAAFAAECAVMLSQTASNSVAARNERPPKGFPKGFPVVPPYKEPIYPASWTMGNHTGGDWIGKYGTEGYRLFAFDSNNSDVTRLPSWVSHIGGKNGESVQGAAFVGGDSANMSFLIDPRRRQNRALGFVTKGADGSQGTVLDVNTTSGIMYKLTLYMVGSVKPESNPTWSFTRQAIRVMDLATLDPIAMDPLIEHATSGVYWTLAYDRGVRLRVMPIDSDAGFSAIFFDK